MPPRSVFANVDTAVITLTGTTPLVMDNIEHTDPEDPIAREIRKITDKKTAMTEEDRHRKDRLAYMASLYLDNGQLIVPWALLRRALATGAYFIGGPSLSGKVNNGVSCTIIAAPLIYSGPEPSRLFEDDKFCLRKMVKKGTGMVPSTRPVFPEWSAVFTVTVLNDICGFEDFVRAAQTTGATAGIGNARKLGYGRFSASVERQTADAAAVTA